MEEHKMNGKLKTVLTVAAVPVFGFILLNLTFMFDYGYQSLINRFFPHNYDMDVSWFPPAKHISFVVVILVISFFIFRAKKLKDIYKAIYACVPAAVVLVTIGMFLNHRQILVYIVSAAVYAAIMLYLFLKKKPWVYWYSVTLTAAVLLIMAVTGVEI